MPEINSISRKKLIPKLKALGFEGPFIAARHQYMLKETHKIFIPNPHGGKDVGIPLLKKIIRQIGITEDDFIKLVRFAHNWSPARRAVFQYSIILPQPAP